MFDLLHDPFVQSSILPLLVGAVVVGVIHMMKPVRRLAAAGIAVTFVIIFALVIGVPALPPPSSMGKLFWASAVGLVLGVVMDIVGARMRVGSVLSAVWLAVSLVWIALPALDSLTGILSLLVLLAVAAWVSFGRLASGADDSPVASAAPLLALALAVGGTALIGSSASIAQMGLALAAATGGFLVWNWPVERHVWGLSGQAAFGVVILLACVLTLFTQTQTAVLLLALPALFADRLRRRLRVPDTGFGRAVATAAVTALAVLPALVAVGAAYLLGGAEVSPY